MGIRGVNERHKTEGERGLWNVGERERPESELIKKKEETRKKDQTEREREGRQGRRRRGA